MAEFENCRILLVDKKISTARDIVGILEAAVRGSFSLLIMAEDIEQEALATMVVNKLRGTLKVQQSAWHEQRTFKPCLQLGNINPATRYMSGLCVHR